MTPNLKKMNKNLNFSFIKNVNFSGLITGIVIGAVAVFAIQQITFSKKLAASALPGQNQTACGLSQMPASSTMYGIISTEQEYNTAISAYQQAHPANIAGATWGGSIGKNHLIAIINSLSSDATEVNFKFITNTGNNKTSLFFQGGSLNAITGELGTSKLYIRTGSASEAFCPTRCN